MAPDFACAYLTTFVATGSLAFWDIISSSYESYLCPVTRKKYFLEVNQKQSRPRCTKYIPRFKADPWVAEK